MKLRIGVTLFLFSIALAYAQTFTLSNAKITFEFPSKNVQGSIEGFESNSTVDWQNPMNSVLRGTVKTATLNTNNGLRNWSLRSSKYFNAKEYPEIAFKSTSITPTNEGWLVQGDLTIKGITKPFAIQFKKNEASFIGSGQLYSSDYDINIKKIREDNLVTVDFQFKLVQ